MYSFLKIASFFHKIITVERIYHINYGWMAKTLPMKFQRNFFVLNFAQTRSQSQSNAMKREHILASA